MVLALVMAAALVVVIIVLAAFLKVESRLAINSVLLTRARLNTVASLRLAQGSMQLMLGPDTRITAPAAAYDDTSVASDTAFDFPVLGVWRSWEGLDHETSNDKYFGRPLQRPNYNLKATDNYDKNRTQINVRGRFLGWLTSNSYEPLVAPVELAPPAPPLPPAAIFKPTTPLPGAYRGSFNSASGKAPVAPRPVPELETSRPKKPRPQVPTVSSAPSQKPLWDNSGSFAALLKPAIAYSSPLVGPGTARRIGDTAIYAADRVTLTAKDFPASLTNQPADGTFAWWVSGENQKALVTLEAPMSPVAGTTPVGILDATQRAKTFGEVDLAALGLARGTSAPATSFNFPSRSSFSAAVGANYLTESVSLANKAGFHDYTTYSPGLLINVANGGFRRDLSLLSETWDWINQVDSGRDVRLPLFRYRPKVTIAGNGADLLYGRPLLDNSAPTLTGNKGRKTLLYWWSDYSNIGGQGISYTDNGTYRGLSFIPPIRSWNTMVDYMLQYRKAVVVGTPAQVVEMRPSSHAGSTGGSNPLYNYHETVYRHPLLARMQFVFSAGAWTNGSGLFKRQIVMRPVVTFWNPYNVRLKVPDVSLSVLASQLPVGFSTGIDVNPIFPIGSWFNQKPGSNWNGLVMRMNSQNGLMDLGPGETRVYSITDPGTVRGARWPESGGYAWAYGGINRDNIALASGAIDRDGNPVAPDSITLDLKPGVVRHDWNQGAGVWLTWYGDEPGQPIGGNSTLFQMRKVNTGRDAIGINMNLGASLGWARSIPIRFGYGGGMFDDSALYLFRSMYGPDEYEGLSASNTAFLSGQPGVSNPIIRPFGTFAFGMRLATDGSTLNTYSLKSTDDNSTGFVKGDPGIVSRGMLQSSPFTCYTELGDKSAEVLVFDKNMHVDNGRDRALQNGIRYFGSGHPINAPFDLLWRPLSGPSDSYLPFSDSTASRGYVVSGIGADTGVTTAVVAELPISPLQSLADLQNWDARGFNPAPPFIYGLIGNSNASPILPADDVVGRWFSNSYPGVYRGRNTPPQFLQHDDAYCLNHVLFDDWFVSSLSPDYASWTQLNDDAKGVAAVNALRTSWAKAIDGSAPLANRAYRPAQNSAELDILSQGSVTFSSSGGGPRIPDAWLKLGAYLTVNGQFNVNSTSVPAWTAVLRSLRNQQIPILKSGDTNASLITVSASKTAVPRLLPSPEIELAPNSSVALPTDKSKALTGFTSLTDQQIDRLAAEIVNQVRIRGPFLSLSEFVNRQLMAPLDNAQDTTLRGALQAALEVVQQQDVREKVSNKRVYFVNAARVGKPTTPYNIGTEVNPKLNPAGFPADYISPLASVGNSSEGLPGWPRQADLLRRLAPIMSVRDETFTVRSLGEVMTAEGNARAWCEAVYQRVPEYVDPRIEPWKAPMGDFIPAAGAYPESPGRAFPYMANALFGRRLKLVSFRWLRADEI